MAIAPGCRPVDGVRSSPWSRPWPCPGAAAVPQPRPLLRRLRSGLPSSCRCSVLIGTRVSALIAAVSAAACYNVAFTQPYGSFTISHPQDIETTALLLVGGLIVGQLSARNRRNRALVVQQSADLAHIQSIAELMAAGARQPRLSMPWPKSCAASARPARVPVRDIAARQARADHRPKRERQLGPDLVGRRHTRLARQGDHDRGRARQPTSGTLCTDRRTRHSSASRSTACRSHTRRPGRSGARRGDLSATRSHS